MVMYYVKVFTNFSTSISNLVLISVDFLELVLYVSYYFVFVFILDYS